MSSDLHAQRVGSRGEARRVRTPAALKSLQERRMQAAEMFERGKRQIDHIHANVPTVIEDLDAGAVVFLSTTDLRVRPLPMR
jgi:hypothetical protein